MMPINMSGWRAVALVSALLVAPHAGAQDEASSAGAADRAPALSVERLVADPSLDGPQLARIRFSPDGGYISFLKGKEANFRVKDLWIYDLEAGQQRRLADADALLGGVPEQLDEVERARRERQRISGSGIVEYAWGPDGRRLLFPLGGDLFVMTLDGETSRVDRLTETDASETDAKFSPRGQYVSFVRQSDLYVIELATGAEMALTNSGSDTVLNGRAEFVAQEEMGRTTGYWWAPDDRAIAYARVDLSPVAALERYELGADGGVTTVTQRYPFAGTDNALVDLRVVAPDGTGDRALGRFGDSDHYLARVAWMPGGERLAVQQQTRDQKRLDLLAVSTADGSQDRLLRETSETWVNLHHNPIWLGSGDRFVWTSDRSGYPHLYRVDPANGAVEALTSGDWAVTSAPTVDAKAGYVYFHGNAETPIERHLYRVPIDPAPDQRTRLTQEAGWHRAIIGPDAQLFVDRFSAPQVPPRVMVQRPSGAEVALLSANALDDGHPYHPYLAKHAPVRFATVTAESGAALHYALRLPPDYEPGRRYPAIVSVYGGPGVQRVRKDWSLGFNQLLARNGFIVMQLDNRGATNRGKAFEAALYRQMGKVEVQDQLAGLDHLIAAGMVDGTRVGVWGSSYGGYMTLMLLAQAPDRFKAGVSLAPVTDWTLYDTHYTERYLGMPAAHGGYNQSNIFSYLDGLAPDRLMLVHGMADDNVFFDHSVKLMAALQERRLAFDLMTYPGKRHGIRGADARAHLWQDALDFLTQRLRPAP